MFYSLFGDENSDAGHILNVHADPTLVYIVLFCQLNHSRKRTWIHKIECALRWKENFCLMGIVTRKQSSKFRGAYPKIWVFQKHLSFQCCCLRFPWTSTSAAKWKA